MWLLSMGLRQGSRNWRYESEPPFKPSPLSYYKQFGMNSIILLMFIESQTVTYREPVRYVTNTWSVVLLNKKIHIFTSQVDCVWQVVKTPTIISNNSLIPANIQYKFICLPFPIHEYKDQSIQSFTLEVILLRCKVWHLIWKENTGWGHLKCRLLWKIFEASRQEVTIELRKLRMESYMIWIAHHMLSRRHTAQRVKKKCMQVLVWRRKRKRLFWQPRRRWMDHIKSDIQ